MRLKRVIVVLLALVALQGLTPSSAQAMKASSDIAREPPIQEDEALRDFISGLNDRAPVSPQDIRPSSPYVHDPRVDAISAALGAIMLPITAIGLAPRGDFVVVVDSRGGVSTIDAVGRVGRLTRVREPMSDADYKRNAAHPNTIQSIIMRGGDPPITAFDTDVIRGRARALFMGLDLVGRTIVQTPPMRWAIAEGVKWNADFDCRLVVYRKSYWNGETLVLGTDLSSVCRTGSAIQLKDIMSGRLAEVRQSPDGRRIGMITEDGLVVRDLDESVVGPRPQTSDIGSLVWLDDDTVLTFSIGRPARVHRLSLGRTVDLGYRASPEAQVLAGLHISRAIEEPDGSAPLLVGPEGGRYVWSPNDPEVAAPAP